MANRELKRKEEAPIGWNEELQIETKKSKARKGKVTYDHYGYFFVLPFILTFLIFQAYPIFYTIRLSFSDLRGWETDFNFVGLVNYFSIFTNDFFLKSFRNTCIVWILNFVPQLGLALLLAVWFTDLKLKLKGVGFFKVVFYLPNIITAGSVAVLFFSLFGYPNGPVNLILMQSGILEEPYNFFRSPMATRSIVAFIQFWMWYGNTLIMIIAGIMGISPSLYEAAMVDGANSRQMFTRITLPLLKPIMLYILVTSLIGGMQMFDIPFLLTNGNPDYSVETMSMFIYKQAFTGSRNFYMASTASVVLLLIVMVISIFAFRFLRSGEKEEV